MTEPALPKSCFELKQEAQKRMVAGEYTEALALLKQAKTTKPKPDRFDQHHIATLVRRCQAKLKQAETPKE